MTEPAAAAFVPSVEPWPVDKLVPYAANARTHSEAQVAQLARSIEQFGFNVPVLVDDAGVLIAGHGRLMAAKSLGMETVPAIRLSHLTEEQAKAFRLADNQLALNAGWDISLLLAELDALPTFTPVDLGFDVADLENMRFSLEGLPGGGKSNDGGQLAERFGVPPFTVLNAREGWWQDRKRSWLSLGIQSELGRGENALNLSDETRTGNLNHYRERTASFKNQGALSALQTDRRIATAAPMKGGGNPMPADRDIYRKRRRANAVPGGATDAA